MFYLLLLFALFFDLASSMARKVSAEKVIITIKDNYLYTGVSTLCSAASMLVVMLFRGEGLIPSGDTMLLSVLFAFFATISSISVVAALREGPLSYTTLFGACSMVLPAFFGVIFYQTPLSWVSVVGIVLMLGCLILSVTKEKDGKKVNWKWFFYSMLSFFSAGILGILQQLHQNSDAKEELSLFLLISFILSGLYSIIFYGVLRKKTRQAPSFSLSPKQSTLWFCVIIGVSIAASNIMVLYLSGKMNPVVLYPIYYGGTLILSTVVGIVQFRERFSAQKWIGLGMGFVSVLLLCLESVLI